MKVTALLVCKESRQNQLLKQPRETNPFNFMRLLVLRLVYGIATMMGFEEGLSEVANGAFVPPGVDDDYGGFDLDGRESDYAYSDNDDDYY
ncbi:hypothetical protein J6590_071084 [Homalodisca vitripennis]|nr:hypothetical protein J6590_071084 [Homalodisca vitripennis]